jgi:hypothetical protein
LADRRRATPPMTLSTTPPRASPTPTSPRRWSGTHAPRPSHGARGRIQRAPRTGRGGRRPRRCHPHRARGAPCRAARRAPLPGRALLPRCDHHRGAPPRAVRSPRRRLARADPLPRRRRPQVRNAVPVRRLQGHRRDGLGVQGVRALQGTAGVHGGDRLIGRSVCRKGTRSQRAFRSRVEKVLIIFSLSALGFGEAMRGLGALREGWTMTSV